MNSNEPCSFAPPKPRETLIGIVLLETVRALPKNKKAFKLTLSRSEFDMVIYSWDSDTCEAYEIKHSKEIVPRQYHVLEDEEQCNSVEYPDHRDPVTELVMSRADGKDQKSDCGRAKKKAGSRGFRGCGEQADNAYQSTRGNPRQRKQIEMAYVDVLPLGEQRSPQTSEERFHTVLRNNHFLYCNPP